MKYANTKFDLRKNYSLIFELALIGALLLFIAAIKVHVPGPSNSSSSEIIHDEPPIVLPPITAPEKTPPPPALARIPEEVPDDTPIEEPIIDFGDIEDVANTLPLPPGNIKRDEEEIVEQVEFMPKLKGGLEALYSDITYPETAKRIGIEGMVVVQFIINKKGEVEDPVIERGIGGGCDEEVLRAIKLQSFSPGVQNGRLVKVRMRQVVHFRLQN